MNYKITKRILMFLCIFIVLGALFGSLCMFIDPTGKLLGMDTILPYFKVLPFSNILFNNYIFSGVSLLITNGITNLIALYFLIKDKKIGIILGSIFGISLMLWIIIQFIILPKNILSITFFILGFIQFIVGYMCYVLYMQNYFKFNIEEYSNIGKNNNGLVIYFSRMGYTKKIAYEEANKLKYNIYEVKTKENISGILGFWWAGRYGMHKWRMQIKDIDINLKNYSNIIIVSPIWVFSISAPIRDLCYKYKNDFNSVSYIFTHFMNTKFDNIADELDNILDKKRINFKSVCIRFGNIINIYE